MEFLSLALSVSFIVSSSFSAEHSFQRYLMVQTSKKYFSLFFLITKEEISQYSLVPLLLRLRIFPVGGVSTGLEMVDDEDTLLGVRFGSDDVDGWELNKLLLYADFSSDEDGSTITDLLEAGVLVTMVDVVVMFDDVTDDGVD